ncbi:MAG TPA: class I SAM-dependent methyltransferase [Thermoanaerobaculia bacterium]|nr:class I SAM-dependent methyltransferase [Thermoanaerobaculia bacterium]
MPELLLLKALDAESAEAPEFRFLLSQTVLEAKKAFGAARLLANPEGPIDLDGVAAVLVLGTPNVLLSAASLTAMRDRLEAGFDRISPVRLADADLGELAAAGETGEAVEPVYTLRGYERLEERFLQASRASPDRYPVLSSHLPVSLFSTRAFAALQASLPLPRLLGEPAALENTSLRAASAGLCHEFIDYYGEERRDVLPLIPPGSEVLEVGCGRGVTGQLLERELGCRVTGVELNPVVAEEARQRLHAVLQGDIQTLPLDGAFDVVLALELVEHLPASEPFLTRARQLLRPSGRLVLSIPNVGHYSIVEDLLAGRWDYLPIGLLCYTHFRFFTRHSLADWLRRCGFESFEILAQKTELPERYRTRPIAGVPPDVESLATKGFYVVAYR